MAFDAFLKIDGVKGEARHPEHEDEIEILTFDWSLRRVSTTSFGGGGAGRPVFRDLAAVSRLQSSSPPVMLACASGKHFDKVVLTLRRTIQERDFSFLKVTMEDCLVSSYQQSGSSGDSVPTDSMSMNFSKITVEYKYQNPDGSLGSTSATWDLKASKGG